LVSEVQPQGKLNQPRIVHLLVEHAEGRWSIDVLQSDAAKASEKELGMVEQIEEFRAELQLHGLTEREWEVFNDGEIRVHEIGPRKRRLLCCRYPTSLTLDAKRQDGCF